MSGTRLYLLLLTSISVLALLAFVPQDDYDHTGRGIDILHYTLNIELSDIEKGEIKGMADLQISLTGMQEDICFDLYSLEPDSVWIDEVKVEKPEYDGSKLIIPLVGLDYDEDNLLVTVFYHGKPERDPRWGGFFMMKDEAFSMGVGMGSNPPSAGRFWYPCVDDFRDKATYDYFITVDNDKEAACPGILKEIYNNNNGTSTWHWEMKQEIPTYISSVAISDYSRIQKRVRGKKREIPVELFVRHKDSLNALKGFEGIPKWLACFEEHFGAYAWDKIGYASVDFPHGAMEHSTIIHIPHYSLAEPMEFQNLYIHEFAHSWFGNLVTCATPGDMWINEGFASYCEAVYHECSGGEKGYKDYVRQNHAMTVKYAHLRDRAYRPVYGPPPEYTYGSTVYDKGADVVHTLRHYLGDEMFFNSMKAMFEEYAFENITTSGLQAFIEKETGRDLGDFFDFWVYGKGFPHFSVDSFRVKGSGTGFRTNIFVRQKLMGTNEYSYSNNIELKLLGSRGEEKLVNMKMSGPLGRQEFHSAFEPLMILIDPNEKISDASIDRTISPEKAGKYLFNECDMELELESGSTSLLRVSRNMVKPDPLPAGFKLFEEAYWSIGFRQEGALKAEFSFYMTPKRPREKLPSGSEPELLYRPGAGCEWERTESVFKENNGRKMLATKTIRNGEYVLAIKN